MEQLEDILRMFIKETNQSENSFGKSRDKEKMLAVKKLMFTFLLNFTLRGTTLTHEELHIPLENIIDKASTAATVRQKKVTQALHWKSEWPRRMTAKVREKKEKTSESWISHCKPFTKGQATATGGGPERVRAGSLRGKGGNHANRGGKSSWQKGNGKTGGKGTEKGGKGVSRTCQTQRRRGYMAGQVRKEELLAKAVTIDGRKE